MNCSKKEILMNLSKYWKTIIDNLLDGLIVVDAGGRVVAMNPAAERLTGYGVDEMIGQSCRILNCTGCRIKGEGTGDKWCGLFASGEVKVKQCVITHKENRAVHVIKNASILRDENGKVIGAVETLTDLSDLIRREREINSLRKSLHLDDGYHGMVGKSAIMQNLYELIENVAQTDSPVIIVGESGTGKELVARAIHETSCRGKNPFIKVNCAALNENLLESELFGHTRGAYTGADRTRVGRFEAAHSGTIFLDEIGDIPMSTQVKLLRTLEEREIERVGDHHPIKVDVRVVSATNKNLEQLIQQGRFREDLYFRINVFPITCPPLRNRPEDIPNIAQHFIRLNNEKSGKKILGMTPEAMEKVVSYSWPGNIRELRNAIEYAFVLCPSGGIDLQHLPPKVVGTEKLSSKAGIQAPAVGEDKRQSLIKALKESCGNRGKAAEILGVSRVTIWKRMKKYNINPFGDTDDNIHQHPL
jgi:two-component system, NtrC family, response regulator HydG